MLALAGVLGIGKAQLGHRVGFDEVSGAISADCAALVRSFLNEENTVLLLVNYLDAIVKEAFLAEHFANLLSTTMLQQSLSPTKVSRILV